MVTAEGYTVEQLASMIAMEHNANAKAFLDESTLATHADVEGKHVTFIYVSNTPKNMSKNKLDSINTMLYNEVFLKSCRVNSENPAFKMGLYYTFIYVNKYNQKISEFIVDKKRCDSLQ